MKGSNVLSFLGGIAAGIVVGILVAPDNGAATRRKVVEYLKEKGIVLESGQLDAFIELVKSKLKQGEASFEHVMNQVVNNASESCNTEVQEDDIE